MLGNPKNAFWEALLLTVVIFVLGLLLGVAIENSRLNDVNDYYAMSEISLMDIVALNNMFDLESNNCNALINSNLEFADRIYEEAKLLEKYEAAGKLTDNIKLSHKKYDLLRTFLWTNAIKTNQQCSPNNFNVVVYLYEYETEDLAQKATQNVWSKVLFDLKQDKGSEIVLIPIAADSNLVSLDTLVAGYGIEKYPVVIVNDKVITQLTNMKELEVYLK